MSDIEIINTIIGPYKFVRPSSSVLDKWEREVDNIIQSLRSLDYANIRNILGMKINPTTIIDSLIKEHFDNEDLTLMSIGLFIFREKQEWNFFKSCKKVIFWIGEHPLVSQKGLQVLNCLDVVAMTKILARTYNINGTVKKFGIVNKWPSFHYYFKVQTGKVLDPMYGYRLGGLFKNQKLHHRFFEKLSMKQRIGI